MGHYGMHPITQPCCKLDILFLLWRIDIYVEIVNLGI